MKEKRIIIFTIFFLLYITQIYSEYSIYLNYNNDCQYIHKDECFNCLDNNITTYYIANCSELNFGAGTCTLYTYIDEECSIPLGTSFRIEEGNCEEFNSTNNCKVLYSYTSVIIGVLVGFVIVILITIIIMVLLGVALLRMKIDILTLKKKIKEKLDINKEYYEEGYEKDEGFESENDSDDDNDSDDNNSDDDDDNGDEKTPLNK